MVAGLIIENGKLLLVHNTKHNLKRVEPPGGKKEAGERWREATIREIREELGILVKPTKLFGIYSTHSPEGDFAVHMYFCEIVKGKPGISEPEIISNFAWYSYEDLVNEENLVPNMNKALPKLKNFL
jgi:8-oxo-dGTP diphosphatase